MVKTSQAVLIPVSRLQEVLPAALPWLQKAIERNGIGYNLEHIVDGLRVGMYQLWAFAKQPNLGFAVSECRPGVGGTEVHLFLAGGDGIEHWIDEISRIEAWAKELGAVAVLVWGRPGWKRMLQKHGYELETQILRRDLKYRVQ